jgi:hypothetical protein
MRTWLWAYSVSGCRDAGGEKRCAFEFYSERVKAAGAGPAETLKLCADQQEAADLAHRRLPAFQTETGVFNSPAMIRAGRVVSSHVQINTRSAIASKIVFSSKRSSMIQATHARTPGAMPSATVMTRRSPTLQPRQRERRAVEGPYDRGGAPHRREHRTVAGGTVEGEARLSV